jgi:L-alanine-DL-glutamate epimerase-like enolase superfamily enzyme
VGVAIIDTPWNGVAESVKIAAMADTYEVNVAPHDFYGHLATMVNAHFAAVVPNLRIMEYGPGHGATSTCRPGRAGGPRSTRPRCARTRRGSREHGRRPGVS